MALLCLIAGPFDEECWVDEPDWELPGPYTDGPFERACDAFLRYQIERGLPPQPTHVYTEEYLRTPRARRVE